MPTQTPLSGTRPSRDALLDTNTLAARWRENGDRRAREALVERFLPLARRLASRYGSPHEAYDDLVQVAALGLLAAIDRYDPARGTAFRSFAVPTILGELKRHFRNTGWSIHVPRGAQEMALRVDQAAREVAARTGRNPRVVELAEYLEVTPEEVVQGIDAGAAHYAKSLDAPLGTDEDGDAKSMIDTLGGADQRYEIVELTASLGAALDRLPELERRAFALRLGHDMRQSDIANELGCSQMHVSRLLRRAGARIRAMMDPCVAAQ